MAFVIIAVVIIVLIFLISFIAFRTYAKIDLKKRNKTTETIQPFFVHKFFDPEAILVISDKLTIALNRQLNKIAMVENYDPEHPIKCRYTEISSKALVAIENKGFGIKLVFKYQGDDFSISFACLSGEVKTFCHEFAKKVFYSRLVSKYPEFNFQYYSSSDWECRYIWAYDPLKCAFAYCLTGEKPLYHVINLRKEFFAIDTNYNYLELPILGEIRPLPVYEKEFLYNVFADIYKSIQNHTTPVLEGKIFYDSYGKILYLSNAISNIQSVIIEKIDDILYRDNRISFTLLDDKKTIIYPTNKEYIDEFEKFITGYNLRKIANNFDYKSDKLINVSPNTKFIIDTTRDRIVYCANLNKVRSFSYMTISFLSIDSVSVVKNATRIFVRIKTRNDEILDVTCTKPELAHYIKAQIDIILAED